MDHPFKFNGPRFQWEELASELAVTAKEWDGRLICWTPDAMSFTHYFEQLASSSMGHFSSEILRAIIFNRGRLGYPIENKGTTCYRTAEGSRKCFLCFLPFLHFPTDFPKPERLLKFQETLWSSFNGETRVYKSGLKKRWQSNIKILGSNGMTATLHNPYTLCLQIIQMWSNWLIWYQPPNYGEYKCNLVGIPLYFW